MNHCQSRFWERIGSFADLLVKDVDARLERPLRRKVGATDVVQSGVRVAYEHRHQFRGRTESEFYGWLRKIVRNKLEEKRRKLVDAKKRNVRREQPLERRASLSGSRGPYDLADAGDTPSCIVAWRETERLVEEEVRRFDPLTARVLNLHYAEGCSRREIAEETGLSQGQVAGRLARGLKKLREALADLDAGWS